MSIQEELEKNGWKHMQEKSKYQGYTFDIIAENRYLFTKWFCLIKNVKNLNEKTLKQELTIFQDINTKAKSIWIGKCFLYVIMTENLDEKLSPLIQGDKFETFVHTWISFASGSAVPKVFTGRVKGGGGNLLVYDTKKKRWYGTIPRIPLDVRKFSEQIQTIIQ